MTSVEWLFEKLWQLPKDKFTWYNVLEEAKEMEKKQITDSYLIGLLHPIEIDANQQAEEYYNNTYASGVLTEGSGAVGEKGGAVNKGSDDQVPDVRKMVDDDKESFLLWVRRNYERCKTGWIDLETGNKHRIEADLVYEYYQLHPTSSQTEISDEEIEQAEEYYNETFKK